MVYVFNLFACSLTVWNILLTYLIAYVLILDSLAVLKLTSLYDLNIASATILFFFVQDEIVVSYF